MFEKWFVLAIFAGVCSTIFNTVNRAHLKENQDSTAYSWWFEFLRAVVFGIFLFFDYKFTFTWSNLLILISLGVSEFVAVYYFMKMHTNIELSVSAVITQFRVILIPLLAFFLIGERLSLLQYLGIGLLLVGLILTLSNIAIHKIKKGIVYAIIFSLASAISSILMKQASGFASISVIMLSFSLLSVFIFPLLMSKPIIRLQSFIHKHTKTIIFAVCASVLTLLFLGVAYRLGTVSQVNAIFLSMFIGNVMVGTLFLDEKFSMRQMIGISIVLVSIFIIH